MELSGSSRPLLMTPNRFTRTSPSAYWNTGNGSPDAVCFSVDRAGVVLAGVCVYGGGGQYEYEMELLDDVSSLHSTSGHKMPSFILLLYTVTVHLYSGTFIIIPIVYLLVTCASYILFAIFCTFLIKIFE